MNYTTSDYLESLQNDLQTISEALNLEEGTNFSDIATMADEGEITKGGGGSPKLFTGHYDSQGLATIGWSSEEIQHYQDYGVQWNEETDSVFQLTETELAGDDTSSTRFIPKSSTKKSFANYYNLIGIPNINLGNTTDINSMFSYCYSLTTIPQLNTSNVTNFVGMFNQCWSLITIPLIDTSSGTTLQSMFGTCYSLKTIPLLDMRNNTTTRGMFYNCYTLKTIPQINMDKVTTTREMFYGCQCLSSLPRLVTTSALTNMNSMFYGCSALIQLDLSGFNTSNVTDMTALFAGCNKLKKIDMRNFSFGSVTNSNNMFVSVPTNCLIIVADTTAKNWILSKRSDFTNVQTVEEYEGS